MQSNKHKVIKEKLNEKWRFEKRNEKRLREQENKSDKTFV
jgi:hypothetical protein